MEVLRESEEITKLSKEVAESDAALAEATTIRQKEKSTFLAVEKDLSESEEACNAAMEVLREYYEGASLIQTGAKAKASADAEGDGSGILGVLEVAASDFATGLAEARAVETEAKSQFDKLVQESKMLKATKTMEIKGKQSEVGSLKTTMTDLSSDKESIGAELDAVLAYLDKLKPQCETKVPTYAERKAAREQEIEGLKDALGILEGSAVFLQTGRSLRRANIANAAQPQALLQVDETPLEKVPLVGDQFKPKGVSTSMQCVISLTIQYMLVYTALALCRTAADVFNVKYDNLPIQDILKTACLTVNYAPMLAVLFLGCRMRVTWLTQGKGNPPEYVQAAMYCATYSVLATTLCVLVIPIFTGSQLEIDPLRSRHPHLHR